MSIAYISCHDYEKYSEGYVDEESLLLDFLREKGLDIKRCIWNDTAVDWKQYDLVILKSPWDYHELINDFKCWLDMLQQLGVRLLNPVATIRWNSDKHYLADIAAAGLKVIPSVFFDKGSKPELSPVFKQLGVDTVIVKPCISAGAKNVMQITLAGLDSSQTAVHKLLEEERYFVQPFMPEIFNGEWALMFFNGRYSHCVLKMPRGDDFRVQHYHGGSVRAATPHPAHIASAAEYVAQFAAGSLYARVDGIICNGDYHLMELELIEPFLYLDTDAGAHERFYEAVVEHLARRPHPGPPPRGG